MVRLLPLLVLFIVACVEPETNNDVIPEATPPTLSLRLNGAVHQNQQFNLYVDITDLDTAYMGVSMQMAFDTTLVAYISPSHEWVGSGVWGQDAIGLEQESGGTLHWSIAVPWADDWSRQTGTMATFRFYSLSQGTANFSLVPEQTQFYDDNGSSMMIPNLEFEDAVLVIE